MKYFEIVIELMDIINSLFNIIKYIQNENSDLHIKLENLNNDYIELENKYNALLNDIQQNSDTDDDFIILTNN